MTPAQPAKTPIALVYWGRLGAGAAEMRILYGGSVKPDNAAEILNLAEVNGALVGGASIKSDDFLRIIRAI